MVWREGWGETVEVAAIAFLIENGHEAILVDTGVGGIDNRADLPQTSYEQEGSSWAREANGGIVGCLSQHGLSVEDISLVIATHLHFDHVGNAPLFTRATLAVSAIGLGFARRHSRAVNARYPYDILAWIDDHASSRLYPVALDETLIAGVRVLHAGGHTPCSQLVVIEASSGPIVLPGDIIPLIDNLDPELPTGNYQNLDELVDAAEFARSLGTVIPSHDRRSPALLATT
jgi:glyoxylase-like metal-dependent hydrolase (beta-lactamase superfamily II)